MADGLCRVGVAGLGTMGSNLALNLAGRGIDTAVYNRSREKTQSLMDGPGAGRLRAALTPAGLAALLARPRALILMVSAGPAVDAVLEDLTPHLEPGDIVIDGGNSHFRDTDRRAALLEKKGLLLLGMGVSGGEEGARKGPSLMPGGPREAFLAVRDILEAMAARAGGEPCVGYMGRGSAGHYVKMVHNGIEYAVMQQIAETWGLLSLGLGWGPERIAGLMEEWNRGELESYLLGVSVEVLGKKDQETGRPLLDLISDRVGQKGTGRWTSQEALELGSPTPTIDAAVMARNISNLAAAREGLAGWGDRVRAPEKDLPEALGGALLAGWILAFDQGLALLARASDAYGYGLDTAEAVRVWRGGCIIRARLLDDIGRALGQSPSLPSLLLDPDLGGAVDRRIPDLRRAAAEACLSGIPAPGLTSSLAYLDGLAGRRLPTALLAAQRDYFGAHGYRRVDRPGKFHTVWKE